MAEDENSEIQGNSDNEEVENEARVYCFYFSLIDSEGARNEISMSLNSLKEFFYEILKFLYSDFLIQNKEPNIQEFKDCICANIVSHIDEIGNPKEKIEEIRKALDDGDNGTRINL